MILRQMFGDEFQGDMPAQADVFRFVNHSHSTTAQLRQHAVMGHRLPNDFHSSVARAGEGVMVGCHPGRVNQVWGEFGQTKV